MANLNNLLLRLCESDIDCVVVGGFAAVLHGSSFVTRDLDLCAALNLQELAKFRCALHDLNPRHRLIPERPSLLDAPHPLVPDTPLRLETDLGSLDVFPSITGVGAFERVRAGALQIVLWDRPCKVICLEDLIRAKEALGRDKDRVTVIELRAIQEKIAQRMTSGLTESP